MSDPTKVQPLQNDGIGVLHFPAMGLAVMLGIAACILLLAVPTSSINVDTVYEGF